MATNQNNIHVNSFTKGMNSDTSLDTIENTQYTFGKNIRITTNALLKAIVDSNSTEGIVAPVYAGKTVNVDGMYDTSDYRILAVNSIENIGSVIIADKKEGAALWHVYRVLFEDEDNLKFSLQFSSDVTTDKQKFSTVINRELEGIVKLYIADGEHQVMQINLMDDEYNEKISGNVDNIISNRIYPVYKTEILAQISGTLPTCQLQYAYRLYKKYGVFSKMSPLTNKIQIIDGNRNKEEGNAEDTTTSVGLRINIPI
uniref:Stabilization protein n=1 Tax=Dulem virus 42 TaxID=3145760 RepID=A0AAU8B9W4_9CAUD